MKPSNLTFFTVLMAYFMKMDHRWVLEAKKGWITDFSYYFPNIAVFDFELTFDTPEIRENTLTQISHDIFYENG